ncbi:hypothetical protein Vretifemale_1601, partial [Volvox reticuliferus]
MGSAAVPRRSARATCARSRSERNVTIIASCRKRTPKVDTAVHRMGLIARKGGSQETTRRHKRRAQSVDDGAESETQRADDAGFHISTGTPGLTSVLTNSPSSPSILRHLA